ncbi:MAG: trypsin-like serine peptidase [Hyphomicrobiaceae bacterium]
MKRLLIRALVCAIVCYSSVPTNAQKLYPGIVGEDDRRVVDSAGEPWEAVGQINVPGHRTVRRCTGTLIAPNLVLTAAHCVMDRWKKKPYPAKNIHFLAGVRGSEHKAHMKAKCLRFREDYIVLPRGGRQSTAADRQLRKRALMTDVAVVVLQRAIYVRPAPLAVGIRGAPGLRLVHAAYAQDRRYMLSAHFDCQVKRISHGGRVWLTDCDTHFASSGGPVFERKAGRMQLAAVMIGASVGHSVALPISRWIDLTKSPVCD